MLYRTTLFPLLMLALPVCLFAQDGGADGPDEDLPEVREPVGDEKRTKKNRLKREEGGLEMLSQEDRAKLYDSDLNFRNKVPYRKSWIFRSGVSHLNLPSYDGWENLVKDKRMYQDFTDESVPGEQLVGILVNRDYMERSKSPFINFFVLAWIPENYAFAVINEAVFERIKGGAREDVVKFRRENALREDFVSFEDYINFKFGRDNEMKSFADGYMMEASDSAGHLTYFNTFTANFHTKKAVHKSDMVGTTTYVMVRGKLLKFEVRMQYRSADDISRILEFTDKMREDLVLVNADDV